MKKLIPKYQYGGFSRFSKALESFMSLVNKFVAKPAEAKKLLLVKLIDNLNSTVNVVLRNGKTRIQLPSHTDAKPRELVLEPAQNLEKKFYVHIRTWDNAEKKIPAQLSNKDKETLLNALYDNLPEGAEILFPLSGEENYATRGTVAGLIKLDRDPRFKKGLPGSLLYKDKDGTVKTFNGTGYIKQ